MAGSKDVLITLLVVALAIVSFYASKNRQSIKNSNELKDGAIVDDVRDDVQRKPVAWVQGQNVSFSSSFLDNSSSKTLLLLLLLDASWLPRTYRQSISTNWL